MSVTIAQKRQIDPGNPLVGLWHNTPSFNLSRLEWDRIVMGDLSAKVGEGNEGYESVLGRHGIRIRNENGERLINFCGHNNLVVTGTIFPHRLIHKQTWTSPGGRVKNQIDHVLHPGFKIQFSLKLRNKYDVLEDHNVADSTVEGRWQGFEKAYKETAQEVLRYKAKGQKPWISNESLGIVEERKSLKQNIEQAKSDRVRQIYTRKYRNKDKEVKRNLRKDKRKWIDNLALQAEKAACNGRMKEVYMLTKTISNDKPKPAFAVKDKIGSLVTGHARTERWREHFEEVLNQPVPDNPVNEIVVEPVIHEISTEPIKVVEIRTVLKRVKNGRAGGKDEIIVELLKADMNITEEWLCSIFKDIWEKEKVPKAWKQGLIVKIPKKRKLY
ncbi:uncharacterized protein LOC117106274 [Anneissia japonica]|uniref:uncharacterized protein LOC117106274 n=1 Tax=Anneissia japonica TaxID=1529436 RepID=UPI001425AAC7|nr:uncharacterized protein LOC117106274 [Anneissia japonica]